MLLLGWLMGVISFVVVMVLFLKSRQKGEPMVFYWNVLIRMAILYLIL